MSVVEENITRIQRFNTSLNREEKKNKSMQEFALESENAKCELKSRQRVEENSEERR